jgi:glycopeptide antibiotics resistance protein
MRHFRITTLLFLYVGYVLIATLYPFELSADFTQSIDESLSRFLASIQGNWKTLVSKDFLVNILLFIPFGVLLYRLLESLGRSKILTICLAAICGGCISFMIELCQVFISRHPQALDVLSNTVGTGTGALLSALWPRPVAFVAGVWERGGGSRIALCLVLLYGALPLMLSIMQVVAPFHIWDSRFSFQIGNEATLNRPWLGKIYLVALYNRALSAYEISNNFYQGFASAGSERRAEGLIALYTFGEMQGDIVHDRSGFREPLDLVISPQDRVRWLGSSHGIEILRPAILKSQQTGAKLITAINETDEMSVEVWLTPDNTEQHGPARIVSVSADLTKRNFTLGQEGANIQFRLRTPVSITNRSPLFLTTRDGVSTSDESHVVATYTNGVERLYLNGKQQPELLNLTSDGIVGFGTRKTAVTQLAYTFFYFFPVSFFLVLFFLARSGDPTNSVLLALAITIGLLIVTEFFQSFAFDRRLDVPLLAYGLIIAALGAVSGRVFATNNGGLNTSWKLSSVS